MKVIPPLIAYLVSDDAARAIEFYKAAFGAEEQYRLVNKGNDKVGHAELRIGDLVLMIADEFPGMSTSPRTLGGRTSQMVLMVENTDTVYKKALAAGAVGVHPPTDEFYGYRMAVVADPGGQHWMIQHEIEKIAPDEMQRRWDAMIAACPESKEAQK